MGRGGRENSKECRQQSGVQVGLWVEGRNGLGTVMPDPCPIPQAAESSSDLSRPIEATGLLREGKVSSCPQ